MATTETPPRPTDPPHRPQRSGARRRTSWYAAAWRWHFYGSLIVIPVLFVLAVTGLTYLYRAQVDSWTHPGVLAVDVPAGGQRLALSAQEASVRHAFPGSPVLSAVEATGERATKFVVGSEADSRNVYVDPYTATVTGDLAPSDLVSEWAVQLHGDLMAGTAGAWVMEAGACWAIVLTLTGLVLFVKGRRQRTRALAGGVKGARLRRAHALVGLPVGLGILGLVFSGLPWSAVWGDLAQRAAASGGSGLWGEDPGASSSVGELIEATNGSSAPAGWAVGEGAVGTSAAPGAGTAAAVSVDRAVEVARAQGAPEPFQVIYPLGPDGVFTVMASQWNDVGNAAESDVSQEQTVHVDQYSGQLAGQYSYADYSAMAKVVSQGIAVHEGRRFGAVSTALSTLFCLAVIFMCVTGPLMWWRRRAGTGGLAAPRAKMPVVANSAVFAAVVAAGLFLPLFGITLVAVLLLDQLVIRRVAPLRRFFGTV